MRSFRNEFEEETVPAEMGPVGMAPGKRTLTMALQRRMAVGPGERAAPENAGPLVERAIAGHGGALPYLDQVQRAFGGHDLSGVQAHVGAEVTAASDALGAVAFATGEHVGFAGLPSLHTVAHEAAHVIQQRRGGAVVQGLGAADDDHERHADLVAERVVRGESAVELLDRYAGAAAPRLQLLVVGSGERDTATSSSSADGPLLARLDPGYDTATMAMADARALVALIGAGRYRLSDPKRHAALVAALEARVEAKEHAGKRKTTASAAKRDEDDDAPELADEEDEVDEDAPARRGRGHGRGRGGGRGRRRGRGRGRGLGRRSEDVTKVARLEDDAQLAASLQAEEDEASADEDRTPAPESKHRAPTPKRKPAKAKASTSRKGKGKAPAAAAREDSEDEGIATASETDSEDRDDTLDRLMRGEEVAQLDGAGKAIRWTWKRGPFSEAALMKLIPGVKSHIKGLVRGALGAPKAGVNAASEGHSAELNQLVRLQPSATCFACRPRQDGKLLMSGNQMPQQKSSKAYQNVAGYLRGDEVSGQAAVGRGAGAKKEDVAVTREQLEDDPEAKSYRMVPPSAPSVHAELNLLDYENRHPDSREQRGDLAVSFPCCMLCAACFLVFGQKDEIAALGYHESRVVNWATPDSLYSPAAFRAFVGDAAADAVGDNQSAMVRLLSLLAGQHDGWSGVVSGKGAPTAVDYVHEQREAAEAKFKSAATEAKAKPTATKPAAAKPAAAKPAAAKPAAAKPKREEEDDEDDDDEDDGA